MASTAYANTFSDIAENITVEYYWTPGLWPDGIIFLIPALLLAFRFHSRFRNRTKSRRIFKNFLFFLVLPISYIAVNFIELTGVFNNPYYCRGFVCHGYYGEVLRLPWFCFWLFAGIFFPSILFLWKREKILLNKIDYLVYAIFFGLPILFLSYGNLNQFWWEKEVPPEISRDNFQVG